MPMHEQVGKHDFVRGSLNTLIDHLDSGKQDVKDAIAGAIGSNDGASVEQERQELLQVMQGIKATADAELPLPYVHYVSRCNLVGLYQAVLSKLFTDIPALQGYGDRNPIWVVTWIEQAAYAMKSFFGMVYEDVHGQKRPLIASFIQAWKQLKFERAPYPKGTPATLPLPEECTVALLADWGGDNPAARNIATVVKKVNPDIAIHLGDIYYGGVKEECEAFLGNWPARMEGSGLRPNANFALNGNHEMYSGGESYFNIVLKAFGQPQPFFCLENDNWRVIGLDTAYSGGRLKPNGSNDPMNVQWNWLISLLKDGPKKGNILLTHHQPVSAHQQEFKDSAALRNDVEELLKMEGIGDHAIFGWFFGHEHRCAIYDDTATPYMARLIGSGVYPTRGSAGGQQRSGLYPCSVLQQARD